MGSGAQCVAISLVPLKPLLLADNLVILDTVHMEMLNSLGKVSEREFILMELRTS